MSHDDKCIQPIRFPRTIANRRALPHIDYRIGDYADIREALLRWRDQTSELARWTHRGSDDPGVALFDATAIVGDILTFYQQLYANECFLRTATWRDSIAELVRLTGYRLAPAIGGEAVFAAKLVGDKPVVIPPEFPISAQLENVEGVATFETSHELTAYPWLSELALLRPGTDAPLGSGSNQLITDAPIDLRRGDRLFLGTGDGDVISDGRIVIVESVRERFGESLIELRNPLVLAAPKMQLAAYRIGRTFLHFGHNAPGTWPILNSDGTTRVGSTTYGRQAIADYRGSDGHDYEPNEVLLEARVPDLSPGAKLLCEVHRFGDPSHGGTFAREVTSVRDRAVGIGPMTAGITIATVDNAFGFPTPDDGFEYVIQEVRYHEALSASFTVKAPLAGNTGLGRSLLFYGSAAEATVLPERKAFVVRDDGSEPIAVTIKTADDAGGAEVKLRDVTLDQDIDLELFDWDAPRAHLLANIVAATQGATQSDVKLGNGDARARWQTFRLPKPPLTYLRSAAAETGHAPELVLLVDGREWRRVDSFFGAEPGDEIYVVREDERGDSFVQAGDGVSGKQFPSGVGNIVARFRTGAGAHGPLRAEAVVRGGRRLPGLDRFLLPGVVTGGEPAEAMATARRAAPAKLQSLGRLVSLADYEAEALAMPGVEECAARWDDVDGVASIVLTVLMTRGRGGELEATRHALLAAERCRGSRRHPIIVRQGQAEYVYVTVSYALQPSWRAETVEPAIAAALGLDNDDGLFGARHRRFGQAEYANRILGVVQNVPGVRWATVDAFGSLGVADDIAELALPVPLVREPRVLCDPDHVLRLDRSDTVWALDLLKVDGVREECEP